MLVPGDSSARAPVQVLLTVHTSGAPAAEVWYTIEPLQPHCRSVVWVGATASTKVGPLHSVTATQLGCPSARTEERQ